MNHEEPQQLTLFPFVERIDRQQLPTELDVKNDLVSFWYGSVQGTIKPSIAQLKASELLAKTLRMFDNEKVEDNQLVIIGGLPESTDDAVNHGVTITEWK